MCGCMLMHATMNHDSHQHTAPQAASASSVSSSNYTCAQCGFSLQADYAFCPRCGMNLRSVKCSACGQKVDPSWASCAYCGSPLGEAQNHAAHH